MKFSGKMDHMIILKITKNQGFTLSLEDILVLQYKVIFFSCIKRAVLCFFEIRRELDSRKKAQLSSKREAFPKYVSL